MVWSEGNMSLKNPVTTPGIDPGTVRIVAQRLNHYATPGPLPVTKDGIFVHQIKHLNSMGIQLAYTPIQIKKL